jgi:hypothetical protein
VLDDPTDESPLSVGSPTTILVGRWPEGIITLEFDERFEEALLALQKHA